MNIESTGIAQEEQVFFDPTDQQETTEKELWKRKEEVRHAIPNDSTTQMTYTKTQQL